MTTPNVGIAPGIGLAPDIGANPAPGTSEPAAPGGFAQRLTQAQSAAPSPQPSRPSDQSTAQGGPGTSAGNTSSSTPDPSSSNDASATPPNARPAGASSDPAAQARNGKSAAHAGKDVLGKITPNAANQVQTVQSGTDAGSVDPSAQGKSSQATDTRDPVAAIAADASQASPTAGIDPAQQALAGIFAAQSAAQGGAAREATSLSPQAKGKGSADTLAPADTRITPASDARRAAAKSSDADLVAALGTAPAASAAPARAGLSPLNTVIPSGDLASATTAPATDANASPFANLMQNAIQNTSGISAGAPAYPLSTSIAPQLGTPAFTQELGQGLVSMAHRGSQSVELSLNPTELGPIRVDIQMAGQTASLSMSAAHEATRTALTQALPQLHEMFAQSGLTLGQAQVGDGGQSAGRDAQPSRNARGNTRELTPEPTNTERLASSATAARIPRLIDTFA